MTDIPKTSAQSSFTQSPFAQSPMFWRVWWRSLTVKRPQSALAFAALALGATVASLLLNLYGDAQRKMQGEFRAYGPNVIVAPRAEAASLAASALGSAGEPGNLMNAAISADIQGYVQSMPGASGTMSIPVLYAVASARPAKPVGSNAASDLVAVGADFAALHAINPAWKLDLAPGPQRENLQLSACVVGAHAAERLGLKLGDELDVTSLDLESGVVEARDRMARCSVGGLVSSGAPEDDQVFLPLGALQQVTGNASRVSVVEMRVPGAARSVEAAVNALAQAFPSLEFRPVREIVQSEGKVLSTIRGLMLALAALILGVVALCVLATVTTIVLERRKEVAVMKALGASDRTVLALLLTEIGALGMAGGLVGFGIGALVARRLGIDLFGIALDTDWRTLVPVLAAAILVAALPALLPVASVRHIDPARALRGE